MRKNPIVVKYSDDKRYRYEVYKRPDRTYAVWVQQKITDELMGADWYSYCDIKDYMHLTDCIARATEIGDEALRNLS